MGFLSPLRRTVYAGGPMPLGQRVAWLRTLRRWQSSVANESLQSQVADTCAIVLSWKRPQNIDAIVRSLLRAPSVGKVVVSNNNPHVRMCDWLSVSHPRLTVIDQIVPQPSRLRFDLAAREKEYASFLAIDDDVFLRPSQIETLCRALRDNPSRIHGLTGILYDSWRGMTYHNMHERTQIVDVIERAYAFTARHLEEYRELSAAIGLGPAHYAWNASYWDSIVMSFVGEKPQVVYLGAYLDCPTWKKEGIATSAVYGYMRLRMPLLLKLRSLRPTRR